jgi:hypothetical protein
LQEQLTALRMTRKSRERERTQAVEHAAVQHAERESRKARVQTLENQIASDQNQLLAVKAFLLPEDRLGELRKLAEGKEELTRLTQEKEEIESVLDGYLREAGRLEELPAGTNCPMCEQMIDPDKLLAMEAKLAASIHEAKNKNQLIYEKIKALGMVRGSD